MYLNLEIDSNSFINRVSDVASALELTPEMYEDNFQMLHLRGQSVPLGKMVGALVAEINESSKLDAEPFAMIIIDPIYKVNDGSENDARDVSRFCNQLDKISSMTGSSVVYVQHHSKGDQGFKKAADQGLAEAQLILGNCYFNGFGVGKNMKEGVELYRKAAEQGNHFAQFFYGLCVYNGTETERDTKEGVSWHQKAYDGLIVLAQAGDPEAQNIIGMYYEQAFGDMKKNPAKALEWFTKAAEQDNLDAQVNVANYYFEGRSGIVPQDYDNALTWFRKAAEKGSAFAMFRLGEYYEKGYGSVEKDIVEAVKWYSKAKENGSKDAEARLKAMNNSK